MHCSVERISFGIRITASPASRFSSRYTPPNPPPPTAFFGGKIVAVCPSFRRVPRVRGAGRPRPGRTCGKRLSWWPVIYLSLSSAWDTVNLPGGLLHFVVTDSSHGDPSVRFRPAARRWLLQVPDAARRRRLAGGFGVICRRMYCARISRVGGGVKVSEMSRMIWRIEDVANLRGRDRSLVEPEEVLLLGHF